MLLPVPPRSGCCGWLVSLCGSLLDGRASEREASLWWFAAQAQHSPSNRNNMQHAGLSHNSSYGKDYTSTTKRAILLDPAPPGLSVELKCAATPDGVYHERLLHLILRPSNTRPWNRRLSEQGSAVPQPESNGLAAPAAGCSWPSPASWRAAPGYIAPVRAGVWRAPPRWLRRWHPGLVPRPQGSAPLPPWSWSAEAAARSSG